MNVSYLSIKTNLTTLRSDHHAIHTLILDVMSLLTKVIINEPVSMVQVRLEAGSCLGARTGILINNLKGMMKVFTKRGYFQLDSAIYGQKKAKVIAIISNKIKYI